MRLRAVVFRATASRSAWNDGRAGVRFELGEKWQVAEAAQARLKSSEANRDPEEVNNGDVDVDRGDHTRDGC